MIFSVMLLSPLALWKGSISCVSLYDSRFPGRPVAWPHAAWIVGLFEKMRAFSWLKEDVNICIKSLDSLVNHNININELDQTRGSQAVQKRFTKNPFNC